MVEMKELEKKFGSPLLRKDYLTPEHQKSRAVWLYNKMVKKFDIKGKRVLEIGCGYGYLSELMKNEGAEVIGIDIVRYKEWDELTVELIEIDVTEQDESEWSRFGKFDLIVSSVAFEHILNPVKMTRFMWHVLKEGGIATISFNVFCSSIHSHLNDRTSIPWIHLIFPEDEILREYGHIAKTNKLRIDDFKTMFEHWFEIKEWVLERRDVDLEFYKEFIDKLAYYTIDELSIDFVYAVLARRNEIKWS